MKTMINGIFSFVAIGLALLVVPLGAITKQVAASINQLVSDITQNRIDQKEAIQKAQDLLSRCSQEVLSSNHWLI